MEKSIRWSLDPETTRSIIAVVLMIIGFILLLSVFGGAGTFGDFLIKVLRIIFGYMVLMVPLILLFFGAALFFPQRFNLRAPTIFGTVAFLVVLSAIIHLFILPESSFKVAGEGGGGGFIGYLISYIFLNIFGSNIPFFQKSLIIANFFYVKSVSQTKALPYCIIINSIMLSDYFSFRAEDFSFFWLYFFLQKFL